MKKSKNKKSKKFDWMPATTLPIPKREPIVRLMTVNEKEILEPLYKSSK